MESLSKEMQEALVQQIDQAFDKSSGSDSIAPKDISHVRLTESLPEKDWWRLYLDPTDHPDAEKLTEPGFLYDTQDSKDFQSALVKAYKKYLDNDSGIDVRKLQWALYEQMYEDLVPKVKDLVPKVKSDKVGWERAGT